jgi:hypothetical protein
MRPAFGRGQCISARGLSFQLLRLFFLQLAVRLRATMVAAGA